MVRHFLLRSMILAVAGLSFGGSLACAEERPVQVCVHDEQGNAIADAKVQVQGGSSQAGSTDQSGCVTVRAAPRVTVEVTKTGYSSVVQGVGESTLVNIVMRVAGAAETVEVTATRTPLALDACASSVRTMAGEQLREAPGSGRTPILTLGGATDGYVWTAGELDCWWYPPLPLNCAKSSLRIL